MAVIVKLVFAVRAETPYSAGSTVLHVTLNFVPSEESNVKIIWLLSVTAVESTTTVVAEAATTTLPAAAEPHTAGDAALEQFVAVANPEPCTTPAVLTVQPVAAGVQAAPLQAIEFRLPPVSS